MCEENIEIKAIRIVMLGDTAVGKTSLMNAFLGLEFSPIMTSNIGVDKNETKLKMKDGNEIKLIIWDTAGQERFHSIATSTLKSSQGIIVSFDLTSESTFKGVTKWLHDIKETNDRIPIVLFGNKCDLINERQVQNEDIKAFAKTNKLEYFETSAKENINIKEGFNKIANEAYEHFGGAHGVNLRNRRKKNKKKGFC